MRKEHPVLAIVMPAYNEGEVIDLSCRAVGEKLTALIEKFELDPNSFVLYVDDGSRDDTWGRIESCPGNTYGVRLSRNFGHQAALLAGLDSVRGKADAVIMMDCDLQHDLGVLDQFVEHYLDGVEIVLGIKARRDSDGWGKRVTARIFYWLLGKCGVGMVPDHADFRLMGADSLEALGACREKNLYLRGMIPNLGFRQATVAFDVQERVAGATGYTVRKMVGLALAGITAFSVIPLRAISIIGVLTFFATILLSAYVLVVKISGDPVPGWTSTVLPTYFLGGIQLLSLGVIGEYVSRVFLEVKDRPAYFVSAIKNPKS